LATIDGNLIMWLDCKPRLVLSANRLNSHGSMQPYF
jgi:hypothetical protein